MEEVPYDKDNFLLSFFKGKNYIRKREIEYSKLVTVVKAIKGEEVGPINKSLNNLKELIFPWEKDTLFDKGEEMVKKLDKYKARPFKIKKVGM